jgi:hypothetical protein
MAAAGLGVVIVCGVLVANRTLVGPDVALFHRINHWPGWLYRPMWVVQLSGVIGALPLLAAAAALLRRFRLAAALAAATLLKVSLEAVAKTFVQRGRPAETGSTVGQWRCWLAVPRTGRPGLRRSRRKAPGARRRPRRRSQATSDPGFSGWYGGRPRHCLICCWMTSGAGRASTV